MNFQEISSGELKENRPVSATLMQKIRHNFLWAFQNLAQSVLINNSEVAIPQGIPLTAEWTPVKTIKIFLPSFAKSIKAQIRAKIINAHPGYPRQMRIYLPSSKTASEIHNFTSEDYEEFSLSLPSADSGVLKLEIQARASYGTGIPLCFWHWIVSWITEAQ